jgi:hypothetical protein
METETSYRLLRRCVPIYTVVAVRGGVARKKAPADKRTARAHYAHKADLVKVRYVVIGVGPAMSAYFSYTTH